MPSPLIIIDFFAWKEEFLIKEETCESAAAFFAYLFSLSCAQRKNQKEPKTLSISQNLELVKIKNFLFLNENWENSRLYEREKETILKSD